MIKTTVCFTITATYNNYYKRRVVLNGNKQFVYIDSIAQNDDISEL